MRYGRFIRFLLGIAVTLGSTAADAQTTTSTAPAASTPMQPGTRLKFAAPKVSRPAESRSAPTPLPSASTSNAVAPAAGSSSLNFRSPRPAGTWSENKGQGSEVRSQTAEVNSQSEDSKNNSMAAQPKEDKPAAGTTTEITWPKSAQPSKLTITTPATPLADEGETPDELDLDARPSTPKKAIKSEALTKRPVAGPPRDPAEERTRGLDSVYDNLVKPASAQEEVIAGPKLTPAPDAISEEWNGSLNEDDWIQGSEYDQPWVGPSSPQYAISGMKNPGRGERFWVRAESVWAFTKGMQVPALVTSSPTMAVAPTLDRATTTILFGNRRVNSAGRAGGRVTMGMWLVPSRLVGLEADYYGLANQSTRFQASGVENVPPRIGRPAFDANTAVNAPIVEDVTAPNLSGTITIDTVTRFQSFGPRFRINFGCVHGCCDNDCDECCRRPMYVNWSVLAGARYARLDDAVNIREDLISTLPGNAGSFVVQDSFGSVNEFYGAEIGIVSDTHVGRFNLELLGRLAMGNNREVINIEGTTDTTQAGVTTRATGGFLALSSNIGKYVRDQFSVVPEIGFTTGYQLTPRLRLTSGYSFIYFGKVLRAGDQIDTVINSNLVPPQQPLNGLLRPIFDPKESYFWVHSLNSGLELRF